MKKLLLMIMLMAPLATFAQKFGKVNTQTIMQALPEIAKINGELQAQQKTYENDLKSMQDELQRQNDAYEKGKSTMNATAQKQKEQELQDPLSEDPADLSGQRTGAAEEAAGPHAARRDKSTQCHRRSR